MSRELLSVARLRRPHGMRGELLAAPDTDEPGVVFLPGRVFTVGCARETTGVPGEASAPAIPARVVLETARPHGKGWLLRFEGVCDREAAERLAGRSILLPREELRPLAEDEIFLHELPGWEVWREGEGRIGTVREVYEAGDGILVEILGEGESGLLPFRREFVPRIEKDARRIWIDPPEGLLGA